MPITAVIITFNEERNIGRCLESLRGVVDEIVVIDSFSTDRTKEICEAFGVRFEEHVFEGHIQQKNYAMSQASHDWVFSLDADEALDNELKESIRKIKEVEYHAYELKRLTNYCGKWIRHCGWYPDTKLRLWNRQHGQWGGMNPHDKVIVSEGMKIGTLAGDLHHYSCYTIHQHLDQVQKFSAIAAKSAYERGIKSNLIINIVLGPFFTFIKRYFFQQGFRDGYYGFVVCSITSFSRFLKYIKLREIESANK